MSLELSYSYNIPYEKIGDEVVPLDVPFDIPDFWEWVRLGVVSTYAETKEKVNAQNANPELWGLDLEDIEKGGRLLCKKKVGERRAVGDKTHFSKGDILYSKLRPYLLKILVADDDGICIPEIVPFKMYGNINSTYIVYYLQSPYVDNYINSITYGVKMPRVGTETMTDLLVPIPPIEEQDKIVSRIQEVEPFVFSIMRLIPKIANSIFSFPNNSGSQYFSGRYRVSLFHRMKMTNMQRCFWIVFVPKKKHLLKPAKSNGTSTNPSFSEGIILIMRSWAESSVVSMTKFPSRYPKIGLGQDLVL